MALVGWWKLDGDAQDSSGFGRHGNPLNSPSWEDGKIGKCIRLNGVNQTISFGNGNTFFPLPSLSISMWFKSEGTTPTTGTGPSLFGFTYGMGMRVEATRIRFYADDGTAARWINSPDNYDFYNDNQWHHVVATVEPSRRDIYIDGVHVGSSNHSWPGITRWPTNGWHIGRDTNNSMYFFKGYIDDVRLYDHALSQKEVKQLSQAKVLHYKFNDFQEPTKNLVNQMTITGHGSSWVLQNFSYKGLDVYRNSVTNPGANNNFGFRHTSGNVDIPAVSTHITISFYSYMIENLDISMKGYITVGYSDGTTTNHSWSYNPANWWSTSGRWNRVHATIALTSSKTPTHIVRFYVYTDNANQGIMDIAGIQIETKNRSTPFTPDSRDGILCDASEYGNHSSLAIETTPAWVENSAIGRGAYEFDGIKETFVTPTLDFNQNDWTVCSWYYPKAQNSYPHILTSTNGQNQFACKISLDLKPYFFSSQGRTYTTGVDSIQINKWSHLAYVYDGSTVKIYINGSLASSESVSGLSIPSAQFRVQGGHGSEYVQGVHDDLRVYYTALSAEDIKEIYQQRASIDSRGNFYSHTLNEHLHTWESEINAFNLIENGSQQYKNNYNWSSFQYNESGNYLELTSGSSTRLQDNYIPIIGNGLDSWEQYRLEGEIKGEGVSSRYYYMIACYDKYFQRITPVHVNRRSGTATVLVQDLAPGDEWVYMDDISNWWDDGTTNFVHSKTLALWHPDDDELFTPYYYTRRTFNVVEVDKDNNRIRLQSPYSGILIPYGSPAQNHASGGTYSYIAASNVWTDLENWDFRSAYTSTTPSTGNVRYGTSYIKCGFLINRNATNPTTLVRNLRFYNVDSSQRIRSSRDSDSFYSIEGKFTSDISEVGPGSANLYEWLPLDGDIENSISNKHAINFGASIVSGNNQNYAYRFNGTSSYLDWPSVVPGRDAGTFSAWVRLDAWTNPYQCVYHTGTGAGWAALRLVLFRNNLNTELVFSISNGVSSLSSGGPKISLEIDQWHHVVATYDGSTARTYRDGLLVGSVNTAITPGKYTPTSSRIGWASYQNRFWDGDIQDIRLYDRALSSEEVGILYELTAPTSTMMKKTATGLYVRGQFNEVSI